MRCIISSCAVTITAILQLFVWDGMRSNFEIDNIQASARQDSSGTSGLTHRWSSERSALPLPSSCDSLRWHTKCLTTEASNIGASKDEIQNSQAALLHGHCASAAPTLQVFRIAARGWPCREWTRNHLECWALTFGAALKAIRRSFRALIDQVYWGLPLQLANAQVL